MRHAVLAEGTLANHPARVGSGIRQRYQRLVVGFKAGVQLEFRRGLAQQTCGRLLQQALTGGVHQSQSMIGIEGEQRRVDFFDHAAQQRCRFDSLYALLGEDVSEGVDFLRQLSHGVVGGGAACAK